MAQKKRRKSASRGEGNQLSDPAHVRDTLQTRVPQPDAVGNTGGTYALCRIMLQAAVPLRIMGIQARGGATAADFARVISYNEELGSEYLLFRSPKAGETARLFNLLSEAIAILAWVPGGITIFEDHYEVPPTKPDQIQDEPSPASSDASSGE